MGEKSKKQGHVNAVFFLVVLYNRQFSINVIIFTAVHVAYFTFHITSLNIPQTIIIIIYHETTKCTEYSNGLFLVYQLTVNYLSVATELSHVQWK